MKLHELSPVPGSNPKAYRKGRGNGSGNGKTAGRGQKGQWARSGGGVRVGFEGGQMPLARRIPKRGFNNIFAKPLEAVNVSVLEKFEDGAVVTANDLLDKGILSKCEYGVKILGEGSLTKKLTVQASAFSASAKAKIETIRSAWKLPELRRKLLFVVFALLIYRVGAAIPVPYINTEYLQSYIAAHSGTIFGLLNTLSGSALSRATLFALSIQPYINASIIIQLLTIAIPALERLAKDGGEDGKKKIQSITRYTTLGIGLLQGFGYYTLIRSYGLLNNESIWAAIVIVMSFTAGAVFLMWLGEQITEFGVGNGISIILFTGIVSRIPAMIMTLSTGLKNWMAHLDMSGWTEEQIKNTVVLNPGLVVLMVIGMLALVVFIVFITNSERKVPVQYAKRVVGRKMYGGQSTHIPIKVNLSGVLPIIFAQSIAMIPATIGMFVPSSQQEGTAWNTFLTVFNSTSALYAVIYFLLIIMFSYFYATIQFNPVEVANNLKKNGGFIPGFRPGRPTAEFLTKVLSRLTFFGAIYLGIVAILPIITENITGIVNMSIGGTSVIIVVGVALETVKMIEAQMLMRHYKGFLE